MFRRRGLVRPLGRPRLPDIPPALRQANELMVVGNYTAAAAAFEDLARGAVTRGGPHAPHLLLQAGRARLLAGQTVNGVAHFQQGLALFAARGQMQRLGQAGNRIVSELNQHGLTAEAKQIEAYLKATLPAGFTLQPSTGFAEKNKPILPTNCHGCGGPLRADEVEWVDDVTVECPYCGSSIRAE